MQIDLKQPILDKNDKLAQSNRELFKEGFRVRPVGVTRFW